jgi:hypothetical protein
MSQFQIVVWGYKPSTSAAALPPGADLQIFMRSLKLVEIPLARGANSKGVETIAIAAGDSIPNMSLQTSPILCRRDEHGVYRSAVKKVCVDDIFDAASSVESTALQALLPVSGCRSFIEVCISLAEFVKVGLPNTRALTAAVTSLRGALATQATDLARGPGGLGPVLLSHISCFLDQEGRGSAPPLPEFARWMTGTVTERFNLSPGLASPSMRSQAAVAVLIRDLHFRLSRHLLQATGGGRFLALLSAGGKNAQSDQLHVIGTHPEDLGTKVMLVVRLQDVQRDMLASELVSKCSVCLTSGVGGVLHARTVRISPRGLFDNGEIIVAFVLQNVHEYMYAYNCLRRFSPCYGSESEELQRISSIFAQSVPPSAQPSVEASCAFRAYMGLTVGGDSPGLNRIFGPSGRRSEFLAFVRLLFHPEVPSPEQVTFLQGFKKPVSWLDGPPGSGKGVMMAVCLTWCARQSDPSHNVFTVACADTRRMADALFETLGRYMAKGRVAGIVHSKCDFARLGRADDCDDWGGHWDTYLEKEFQTRLADELSLLQQLDTRLQAAEALYTSSRAAGSSYWPHWKVYVELHVLRERFVREVLYPAERRALVDVMAEVPGLVVTTSFLRKLLGGDPKEIPSQSERDFGSLQHWTQLMRFRRGTFLWVDEHQADSPQLLAPVLLHFDDAVLSGGATQTMRLHSESSLEVRGNTVLSLVQSVVSSVSGSSECSIKAHRTDMLRYEMSSDWLSRNPCVETFRLRNTHRYSSCICKLLAAVLQRDYISVAMRDSSLIPVFLGWLTDSAVNEKDEVCFSPRLVAVLLRVLVHAFSYASSVLVVGFYADLLGRVEQAVRALLPSALPDGVGVVSELSFATPTKARGGEFDVEVVLAIKKNRAATCWTGRYFLDPGCIEIALTRGIKGTYVLMDEVLEPDATTTHKSVFKKQMIWWNVRQYLWYECQGLPRDAVWDRLWASNVVHRGPSGVVGSATLSLAASFSWDTIRYLVDDDTVYAERSNLARQEFDAVKPVEDQPANLKSYMLDAVFLRREGPSKFSVNVPTLCWYAWGRHTDPHHLACDLWHRVRRLCSHDAVASQSKVLRHKKALKFIGCHEVLAASAHSDRWGYEITCRAPDDEVDGYLYIYPCMGLVRQHAFVTSVLAKSNSIVLVRKLCRVLSSQMACRLDLCSDPDRVLLVHQTPARPAMTMASVRQALQVAMPSVESVPATAHGGASASARP